MHSQQNGSPVRTSFSAQKRSYGHKRRPSIGKSMPVTALLLNLPPTVNMERYTVACSRDGILNSFPGSVLIDIEDDLEKLTEDDNSDKNDEKESESREEDHINTDSSPQTLIHKDNYCKGNIDLRSRRENLHDDENLDGNEEKIKSDISGNNDEVNSKMGLLQSNYHNGGNRTRLPLHSNENVNNCIQEPTENELEALKLKNPAEIRMKLAITEALAKTSMMTSPAAKRRLAARKMEMLRDNLSFECDGSPSSDTYRSGSAENEEFIPPKDVLLYLVRMGSFNSAPRINNTDCQDDSIEIPQGLTTNAMLQHCKLMRGENGPKLLERSFIKPSEREICEGIRLMELNTFSKICSKPSSSPNHIRILQWNILSQTLGQNSDGFVRCPDEALLWDNRKFLIVEEILKFSPDIVCLQEVDHFKFLERVLSAQNYKGIFFPKPDSPCLYVDKNNGPDGCAIFYKTDKFEVINCETKILEIWRVQSNQVAIAANLRVLENDKDICICTTHLKARKGALLSQLRNEQGKDLLKFLQNFAGLNRPVILCGDFNAEPIEPVYSTVINNNNLNLSSAYSDINAKEDENKVNMLRNSNSLSRKMKTKINSCSDCSEMTNTNVNSFNSNYNKTIAEVSATYEPSYTTWKIREEGEVCHTIDYVFYSKNNLKVINALNFPDEDEVGQDRTPSFRYPSDHFSLVCDFEIIDKDLNQNPNNK